jgi:putative transcriptional regulator
MKPSRVFKFRQPDVRSIRDHYGLSQPEFADMLGISVSTLRNWEQGRRQPEGAARVLLRVTAKYPDAVLDVVYQTQGIRAKKNGKTLRAEKKIRWPNKKTARLGNARA